MRKKIAIIGGGLSGLYAAYLLEQNGITDYILLEARERFGGRVMDFNSDSQLENNRFDLGPTWFWPEFQPQLNTLIKSLKLDTFSQYEQGNILLERSHSKPPSTMPGYANSPTSMRLKGGMGALINALRSKLINEHIISGAFVESIVRQSGNNEVCYRTSENTKNIVNVEHIMLAVPPRLAIKQIKFIPTLPSALAENWKNTATWMAPHAKYIAVFNSPFWREQGLSGSARSSIGPMTEIHDASNPDGQAALFGFIGVSAADRQGISEEDLLKHCRVQLVRLFGSQAESPTIDIVKDWAIDSLTSTHLDTQMTNTHNAATYSTPQDGPWHQKLVGIGSEWSKQFPGYLAGAIDAAKKGVTHYINTLQ
ncbi:flavin monoamine oxidase family protein [Psychrosphaera haliotis]|uniref:NAD(P)-binding protein n=1 Tax=Psychrosphaera haliotis TaxID=555083 RepID=A0A6N8F779_9GAMM|nr:FAD-dependent oxidoreductase [Psychrosphaera haliotis]MUH72243.1 NAD(P)-binding protein [Psychrosphaera haliotis]